MKKLIYIGLSVIAFSAVTNISMADELEEVIVTSSLIDPLANDISNPFHIIDGKSLTSDATQSIGGMIDNLAGVSSSDFGAAVGQPVIRGLSGSRVKLLNNGKVVRDISSLGPDHSNEIDLGHLQQIEIVRGPSSLLYANGAVGGMLILLITQLLGRILNRSSLMLVLAMKMAITVILAMQASSEILAV